MSSKGRGQRADEVSTAHALLSEDEVFDILFEATKKAYLEAAESWDERSQTGSIGSGLFLPIQSSTEDRGTQQVSQERIEELADYYDRTDTTELEDGVDVTNQVQIEEPNDMEQISIRLPREDLEQIRSRAKAAGVGYTTMIRMIVHAHLENPLTY
ncbi:hypothetical protein BH23ACT11_BH23ACT11_27660 [soil metagenome]